LFESPLRFAGAIGLACFFGLGVGGTGLATGTIIKGVADCGHAARLAARLTAAPEASAYVAFSRRPLAVRFRGIAGFAVMRYQRPEVGI